jgi:DNA polymerase III subunit gamma/tau
MGAASFAAAFRPRFFADVVGQRHVVLPLRRAVELGTVPKQLLFIGSSGLGKTTLARVTAAALLCDANVAGEPCGVCESCVDLFTPGGAHPDVDEFDAASNGLKDDIRELAQRAQLAPLRGSHRVFIIDEAHGLSNAGGQAFLKLLEEPPPHVVFMLATTDPQKMLATNRSRCIEFELLAPSVDDMARNLVRVAAAAGFSLDAAVASEVVDASDPALGVRGTVMLLEKLLVASPQMLDLDAAAELLGRPPRADVDALVAAFDVGLAESFAAFDVLRGRFQPSSVLRRAAQRVADDLAAAAAARNGERVAAGRVRLEALTAAAGKPGELHAKVALAVCAGQRVERLSPLDVPLPSRPSPAGMSAGVSDVALLAKVAELEAVVARLERRVVSVEERSAHSDVVSPVFDGDVSLVDDVPGGHVELVDPVEVSGAFSDVAGVLSDDRAPVLSAGVSGGPVDGCSDGGTGPVWSLGAFLNVLAGFELLLAIKVRKLGCSFDVESGVLTVVGLDRLSPADVELVERAAVATGAMLAPR